MNYLFLVPLILFCVSGSLIAIYLLKKSFEGKKKIKTKSLEIDGFEITVENDKLTQKPIK